MYMSALSGSNICPHLIFCFTQRVRDEGSVQAKIMSLEEDLSQARKACDVWRCKAIMAEQQRDEVHFL